MAQTLGLERIVRFTGFRRDVPEVMSALDLFVFPSHAEAFGLVLIEAMAMERPVVSTNCDGVLDIVVDGVTGLTVPPKDPVRLAAAIEQNACGRNAARSLREGGTATRAGVVRPGEADRPSRIDLRGTHRSDSTSSRSVPLNLPTGYMFRAPSR